VPIEFHRPRSLDAAVELLASDAEARPLAGGQTLVAMLNLGYLTPSAFVYLGDLGELRGIRRLDDGSIRVGAMTTHAEIAAAPVFTAGQDLIAHTARQIADAGIRNCGTLGGACAHGDPVTDWPPALVAAGATLEVRGAKKSTQFPARDFFLGLMSTALQPGELITAIVIPPIAGKGLYRKLVRAEGDYATLSVAVTVDAKGGRCRSVAVAVGACGPRPVRLEAAEKLLVGQPLDEKRALDAGRLLAGAIEPLDDVRASAAYRRRVLPGVVARTLLSAL